MPLSTAPRLLLAGVVLALFAGAGFAVFQLSQTRAERDALRAQAVVLQERADAADREVASLRQRLDQATRFVGNPITLPATPSFLPGPLQPTSVRAAPAPSAFLPGPPPATSGGVWAAPTPSSTFVARRGGSGYAALHRKLGLTNEQMREFERLVLTHRGGRDFAEETAEINLQEAVRARFGDRAVAELALADAERRFSPLVQRLAGQLFSTPDPLSAEQQDRLVETLATVTRSPSGALNLGLLDENDLAMKTASFLTPNQIEAMKVVIASFRAKNLPRTADPTTVKPM